MQAPTRIIDAHIHLMDESGYMDKLLSAMDRSGIEKCCISGLGPLFGMADNRAVQREMRRHPDRVIGAWFVRPGVDGPEMIDRAASEGFRMIKVTLPRLPYDAPECDPLWERALAHGMPVLFHTGLVAPQAEGRGERISSWNMHPVRVEPVTREFPDLKVIVAHLGVNWNLDAAELIRMRPNAYADLTGEPDGWRVRVDRGGIERYLWWEDAFDKIVFGTDVHWSKLDTILRQDLARLDRLGIGRETRERLFHRNISEMLGHEV